MNTKHVRWLLIAALHKERSKEDRRKQDPSTYIRVGKRIEPRRLQDQIAVYLRLILLLVFCGVSGCLGDEIDKNIGTPLSENIPEDAAGTTDDIVPGTPSDIQDNSIVDNDYIGAFPSLVVGPDGTIHASYFAGTGWGQDAGGALRHAVLQNGVWMVEDVDGDLYSADGSAVYVGVGTAIAVDPNGGFHISYLDMINQDLKYATLFPGEGQSWLIETVPLPVSPIDFGVPLDSGICKYTDVEIDAAGSAYIGYCIAEDSYYYVTNKSGVWVHEEIAPGADFSTNLSLQLGSLGKVHVSFFDAITQKVKYGVQTLDGWQIEEVTILETDKTRISLTLDNSDPPRHLPLLCSM